MPAEHSTRYTRLSFNTRIVLGTQTHIRAGSDSYEVSYAIVTLPFLAALACGQRASQSEPKAPVAPITITGDLENIDVCRAVPREDIEAVMGRKLVAAPQHF